MVSVAWVTGRGGECVVEVVLELVLKKAAVEGRKFGEELR